MTSDQFPDHHILIDNDCYNLLISLIQPCCDHILLTSCEIFTRVVDNISIFLNPGKWRICADHAEMKFDLKTTTVVEDFEIRGDQWYSSYDDKQMKYLQVNIMK